MQSAEQNTLPCSFCSRPQDPQRDVFTILAYKDRFGDISSTVTCATCTQRVTPEPIFCYNCGKKPNGAGRDPRNNTTCPVRAVGSDIEIIYTNFTNRTIITVCSDRCRKIVGDEAKQLDENLYEQ